MGHQRIRAGRESVPRDGDTHLPLVIRDGMLRATLIVAVVPVLLLGEIRADQFAALYPRGNNRAIRGVVPEVHTLIRCERIAIKRHCVSVLINAQQQIGTSWAGIRQLIADTMPTLELIGPFEG